MRSSRSRCAGRFTTQQPPAHPSTVMIEPSCVDRELTEGPRRWTRVVELAADPSAIVEPLAGLSTTRSMSRPVALPGLDCST